MQAPRTEEDEGEQYAGESMARTVVTLCDISRN